MHALMHTFVFVDLGWVQPSSHGSADSFSACPGTAAMVLSVLWHPYSCHRRLCLFQGAQHSVQNMRCASLEEVVVSGQRSSIYMQSKSSTDDSND